LTDFYLNASKAGHVELPFDAFFFGVIALGVLLLLGAITWSYRDVANRHSHKDNNQANH
jgi:hypothetical protein